jgi:hypothetical protein
MATRKSRPTPPMTEGERAARIDEMNRLNRRIQTTDDWASILSYVGLRAAQLTHHQENIPQLTLAEGEYGYE